MAKILDTSSTTEKRIGNDAFFFIVDKEPMLDPDEGEAEVKRLNDEYPLGFKVECWDYDTDGEILAVITPYILDPNTKYNLGLRLTNSLFIEAAYYEGDATIDIRFVSAKRGVITDGCFKPETIRLERNKHGLLYFLHGTPDRWSGMVSRFYIKHLIPIEELEKFKLPEYGWAND